MVVPMLHATSESAVWQICQQGLAIVVKENIKDEGFFGRGLYLTSSLDYASSYPEGQTSNIFLVCCTLPVHTFPVTEHPHGSSSLKGKHRRDGYFSHYTVGKLLFHLKLQEE